MSWKAKRLCTSMWGTCTSSHDQSWRVLTACMQVQRITPFIGVIAPVHMRLPISNGLVSILSSNLLYPILTSPWTLIYCDAHGQSVTLDLSCAEPKPFVRGDPRWRFTMLPTCSFGMIFVASAHSRGTRIFRQQDHPDEQKAPSSSKRLCTRIRMSVRRGGDAGTPSLYWRERPSSRMSPCYRAQASPARTHATVAWGNSQTKTAAAFL